MRCPVCQGVGEILSPEEARARRFAEDLAYGRQLIATMAIAHGVTLTAVEGPSRVKKLVNIRREAAVYLTEHTTLTLRAIGLLMGNRDHSTVTNLIGSRRRPSWVDE